MQCLFVLANQLSQERVLKLQQEVAAAEQPTSRSCWGDVRPICMEGRSLWSNCSWTANHQAHSDMVECCMKHCWSRTLGGRNCRICSNRWLQDSPHRQGQVDLECPLLCHNQQINGHPETEWAANICAASRKCSHLFFPIVGTTVAAGCCTCLSTALIGSFCLEKGEITRGKSPIMRPASPSRQISVRSRQGAA